MSKRCASPLSTEVVESAAEPALVAASSRALMVVVGARGHSRGYHVLVGSASVHLAQYAQAPVVTVREQSDPTSRQVVVGADGSAGSAAALRFAFESARAHRLPLLVLHGWRTRPWSVGTRPRRHCSTERWPRGRSGIPKSRPSPKPCPVALIGCSSKPRGTRVWWSSARVAAPRGHEVRLGRVSEAVLHHARCPVAIAR